MKKSFKLAIAIGRGLNTAEAQPLPIRVGYTALAGSFTPPWMAKLKSVLSLFKTSQKFF
jgi:hypothetical protein